MCKELSELCAASKIMLLGFEPGTLDADALKTVLAEASAIQKSMETLGAMAAAQLAKLGAKRGERVVARELARASGTSLSKATRALEAAQRMRHQPDVEEAAREGNLSREQLALVSESVEINPMSAGRLLNLARTGSLAELVDEAARAQSIGKAFEQRRKELHAARCLKTFTDAGGAWGMMVRGLPEDGARIVSAIEHLADDAFRSARQQGVREPREAYLYDGLVALTSRGGVKPSQQAEILVRIDHSALVRGYTLDGEVCEVAGFGAVSPEYVYDLMQSGDPFIKALITKGKDVLSVAHFGRRPNSHQKTALDWMFPTCAAEGCASRGRFLQSDHRVEWSKTHITALDMIDRLCKFDHDLKTYQGWALVDGRGKRPFVPPNDPRHPRFAQTKPQDKATERGTGAAHLLPSEPRIIPSLGLGKESGTVLAAAADQHPRSSEKTPVCHGAQPASLHLDDYFLEGATTSLGRTRSAGRAAHVDAAPIREISVPELSKFQRPRGQRGQQEPQPHCTSESVSNTREMETSPVHAFPRTIPGPPLPPRSYMPIGSPRRQRAAGRPNRRLQG